VIKDIDLKLCRPKTYLFYYKVPLMKRVSASIIIINMAKSVSDLKVEV